MSARKKKNFRDQIFALKVKAWSLYGKMQVQKVLENTSKQEQEALYRSYRNTYRHWGGVELTFWLTAVAKICKQHDPKIESVAVFPLPARNSGNELKLTHLKTIARQMGLDVTIKENQDPLACTTP